VEEKTTCESEHCSSHQYMERTMDRLEEISADLTKGQREIIGVIKDVSRLGERVEKLEGNQDEIRKWMFKVMGVVTVAAFIVPLVVTYLLGKH
jgi:archaellum component FlaC